MPSRRPTLLRFTALAAALALAACNGGGDEGNLASLDNQLVGDDADPALTSALADQILVDPTLANQSNKNAVRPPETPTQAQYPLDKNAAAAKTDDRQARAADASARTSRPAASAKSADRHVVLASAARGDGGTACAGGAPFDYGPAWAKRLSPAFPAYPGARITEAAGNNRGDCRVRAITFTTAAGFQQVLDWYHTRAVRAGYSSEHQVRGGDHILAGANNRDGGAFYLIVTPKGRGSEAALIANNGY
jgi:hypothetical protein